MYLIEKIFLLFCFFSLSYGTVISTQDLRDFYVEMQEHGYTQKQLKELFAKVKPQSAVIKLFSNQPESLPWGRYRKRFLNQQLLKDGLVYWKKHQKELDTAYAIYGVPPEIIVAILGVESRYGQVGFYYRVIDVLYTLSFAEIPRRHFFRNELKEYLILAKEIGFDPLLIKGSYAGAIGKPQFMPSSYRRWAIDFDKDGKVDLLNSDADAIGSIANYLKEKGWRKNEIIAVQATARGERYRKLLQKSTFIPNLKSYELFLYGVKPYSRIPLNAKCRLILLESDNGEELWVAFNNFYVITLYNRSTVYGMAVFQLAQKLKEAFNH